MYSEEPAIRVADLSKCYYIYNRPIDRLKQSIMPKAARLLGRPPRSYFREFWALRNLTLDVQKGETIGVIGRNGSGKSTLLQMICGTLTPTGGHIETKGRITALLELGSGFNPEFTGRENVFLNGAILGLSRDEIEHRFSAIAGFADIGEFIEQPVKFYSSGMTVRLAFAVQAMVDPDILIVDEALAVGDERFQRKCFQRIEELKKNGTSILFVSHAGQQIVELCDRALLLEQGRRLLLSDPLTVVRAYHQMIYADPLKQAQLTRDYQELDRSGQSVPLPYAPQTPAPPSATQNEKISEADFYESGMIPESTVDYPSRGARIESIKIFNIQGRKVNNLLAGREYHFEICGVFLEAREILNIGMHIRTKTGVEITTQAYPGPGRQIQNVKRGQRFRLIHKMTMTLTPGIYFAGAGISSTTEPVLMHRILDAIMFRVLPKAEKRASGYVDLSEGEPEFEISEM
jgi:lipopolysaccharide transport system ATP-binding protein